MNSVNFEFNRCVHCKIDIELLSTYIATGYIIVNSDLPLDKVCQSDPVEVETASRSGTVRIDLAT